MEISNQPSAQRFANNPPSFGKTTFQSSPCELMFEKISVNAIVPSDDGDYDQDLQNYLMFWKKYKKKKILKQCSGKFSAKSFTTIIGPSGCGKTTMMNLISGRMLTTKNLQFEGKIRLNGIEEQSPQNYQHLVGYVTQQDLMMPFFTPKQSFNFVANLRLPHLDEEEKQTLINHLLVMLGLEKCKNTYIGDNIFRGISGGQKKRTHIGLQLLTNPSILFLDQPTTGLDSTTAYKLIQLLKKLAQQGKTVIATLHQPSSEAFQLFDRLIIMVKGYIIYQGDSKTSINYFKQFGFSFPEHSNPLDNYLKMIQKEGLQTSYLQSGKQYKSEQIDIIFQQRIQALLDAYYDVTMNNPSMLAVPLSKIYIKKQQVEISWAYEALSLVKRNYIDLIRSPLGLLGIILVTICLSIAIIILYEKKANDIFTFDQNLRGMCDVLTTYTGHIAYFAVVLIFGLQRPIFFRQKLRKTYRISTYFFSKILSFIPYIFLYSLIIILMSYWFIGLKNTPQAVILSILANMLGFYMAMGFGFIVAALIPNVSSVLSLSALFIVPFQATNGFLRPTDQIHDVFWPFKVFSFYRYNYQAMVIIQYQDGAEWTGLPNAPRNILDQYHFKESLWLNLFLQFALGTLFYLTSFLILFYMSSPPTIIIKKISSDENIIKSKNTFTLQIPQINSTKQAKNKRKSRKSKQQKKQKKQKMSEIKLIVKSQISKGSMDSEIRQDHINERLAITGTFGKTDEIKQF